MRATLHTEAVSNKLSSGKSDVIADVPPLAQPSKSSSGSAFESVSLLEDEELDVVELSEAELEPPHPHNPIAIGANVSPTAVFIKRRRLSGFSVNFFDVIVRCPWLSLQKRHLAKGQGSLIYSSFT
ncbi:hypothetical protein ALT1644_290037 [Alteromonas macleodii]